MKPPTEDSTIAISPALVAELKAAADEEKLPAEEVLRDAIERYLRNRRRQRIFTHGQESARTLGLSEEDIPRLIAESPREQRPDR